MKPILAVIQDFKSYFNIKTKLGRKRLFVAIAIVLVLFIAQKFLSKGADESAVTAVTAPRVTVQSVAELGSDARFDTVGKVEAVSEANLQTESGGRVTAVAVTVGQSVGAGQVLASLENSAQRAALTQAQGAYEAALAAAAQSDVSVSEASTGLTNAQNGAVNAYKNAYNTVNSAVRNNIDLFFSSPESTVPGLRIDGRGQTMSLNSERVAYQSLLATWQSRSNSITAASNLESELAYAKASTERTIVMVDTFISLFNQSGTVGGYTTEELQSYSTSFTALRANLLATSASIDNALAGLSAARDAVTRAELASSGGAVSAADAQVKIALGALQLAQASYEKTIIRTPIQGVVNAFYLKAGDYVSPGQPAGIVANNNGLQIKTFINEIDSANITVGDTVTIEGGATGVITAKAAALDPSTGKVAVVIGVNPDSSLTNGATVKVTFSQVSANVDTEKIVIPLSALKITSDETFVFTVNADNKLEALAVTKGQLYGENVEILSGVSKETRIVVDARGLKVGQTVVITE